MRKMLLALALLMTTPLSTQSQGRELLLLPHIYKPEGAAASPETRQNMRFGCKVTAKSESALEDCLSLADKLHDLVSLANQEILRVETIGRKLSKAQRDGLLAEIDKSYEQVKAVSSQILERYPYVRFYITPRALQAL